MTVTDTTSITSALVGNSSSRTFSFSPMVIYASTDIEVLHTVTATDVTTVLTEGVGTSNYSVDFTVFPATGSITYPASILGTAMPLTETLTIKRVLPITQTTDLTNQGAYLPETLETALDKSTILLLQMQEQLDRAILIPSVSAVGFDGDTPVPVAGYYLNMDSDLAGVSWIAGTNAPDDRDAAAASAAEAAAYAGTQTVDLFNGTGSQTAFTLSVAPANGDENNTDVHISGVYQQKNTYSLSGTTLTFSAAPPAGTGNVEVMHMSQRAIETPADGSVTYPKFASGLVDTDLSSVSGSDDTIASAKSIKTYVDAQVTASDLDFAGGTGTGAVDLDSQTFTVAGTANEIETAASGQTITVGLPANITIAGVTTHGGNVVSDADSTDSLGTTGVRWAGTWTDAINGVTSPTAQYTSAEETKLDGIEASADVTDATNVLAGLVGQEAVATGFTGTLDGVLGGGTPAAATVTTLNGVTAPTAQYTTAEETKLSGIETAADVTDATNVAAALANGVAALTSGEVTQLANIGTAAISAAEWGYVAASTQAYDSADHSKLDGIEASADVTDATNVTAAGALMDSELTAIASVKALNQGVATGDSPSFSALTLSGGNLLFSSAAKGVYLGVTTATAANLLDDYEEGDWTPTIGTGATVSSDAAYNASYTSGQYTKVGRIVHCTATLRLTDKGTQSGNITILGLPFASANNVKYRATWSSWFHGAADMDLTGNTAGTIMMYQAHNTSYISVRVKDPATAAGENVAFADISDTVYLQISGSYVAA